MHFPNNYEKELETIRNFWHLFKVIFTFRIVLLTFVLVVFPLWLDCKEPRLEEFFDPSFPMLGSTIPPVALWGASDILQKERNTVLTWTNITVTHDLLHIIILWGGHLRQDKFGCTVNQVWQNFYIMFINYPAESDIHPCFSLLRRVFTAGNLHKLANCHTNETHQHQQLCW